jgi:hypothetical protein
MHHPCKLSTRYTLDKLCIAELFHIVVSIRNPETHKDGSAARMNGVLFAGRVEDGLQITHLAKSTEAAHMCVMRRPWQTAYA